jgi:hypothetical protein
MKKPPAASENRELTPPPRHRPRPSKLADILIIILPPADKTGKARESWATWIWMLLRLAVSAVALWKAIESTGWM